jgi:hypothetical protein
MREDAEFARFDRFVDGGLVDVRRADSHRAKRGHPLFGAVGLGMSLLGEPDPRTTFTRLEARHGTQM